MEDSQDISVDDSCIGFVLPDMDANIRLLIEALKENPEGDFTAEDYGPMIQGFEPLLVDCCFMWNGRLMSSDAFLNTQEAEYRVLRHVVPRLWDDIALVPHWDEVSLARGDGPDSAMNVAAMIKNLSCARAAVAEFYECVRPRRYGATTEAELLTLLRGVIASVNLAWHVRWRTDAEIAAISSDDWARLTHCVPNYCPFEFVLEDADA